MLGFVGEYTVALAGSLARPARMPQLRGSPMVLWDDFLPPVPALVREANAAAVVDRLVARVGGERG